MHKLILILVFYLNSIIVFGSSFSKVDTLLKQKQFLDAWNLLSKKENKKNKVNINLKKFEICLNYFTKSVSHQAFAFTNLKPSQSLIRQRILAETKTIPIVQFKINEVLDSLLNESPENYLLHKAKGDYYYDIFILYGRDWIVNRQEVLRRMFTAYDKAEKNGVMDYLSLYALGYFYNLNEQSNKALQYFNRSLKLDSNYAPTHYNLAYIYSSRDSNEIALYHSWNAYRLYKYINYRNDAGQMTGSLLGKLNRHEEAISILLDCDRLIPNTYQTYSYLLNSFLSLNKMTEAMVTTQNMFSLDWKSHTINTDIIESYIKNNHIDQLIQFYNSRLEIEKYDMEFRGYIQLHLAQAYSLVSEEDKILEYIELARASFNICFDSSHPVFGVLNNMENK